MVNIQNIDLMGIDAECATVNCLIEYYQKQLLMENIYQEGIGDERLAYRGTDENGNKENLFMSILKFIGRLINNIIYRAKNFFNKNVMKKIESDTNQLSNEIQDNPQIIQPTIDCINGTEVNETSSPKFFEKFNNQNVKKAIAIGSGVIAVVLTGVVASKIQTSDYKKRIQSQIDSQKDNHNPRALDGSIQVIGTDEKGNEKLEYHIDRSAKNMASFPDVDTTMILDPNATSKSKMFVFETQKFDKCNRKLDEQMKLFEELHKLMANANSDKHGKIKNLDKAEKHISEVLKNNTTLFNHDTSGNDVPDPVYMTPNQFTSEFTKFSDKVDRNAKQLVYLHQQFEEYTNILNSAKTALDQNDQMPIGKKADMKIEIDRKINTAQSIMEMIRGSSMYVNEAQAYQQSVKAMLLHLQTSVTSAKKHETFERRDMIMRSKENKQKALQSQSVSPEPSPTISSDTQI